MARRWWGKVRGFPKTQNSKMESFLTKWGGLGSSVKMPVLPVRHCLYLLKVKKKNLWTYIQTCQKTKTSFMQGVALATALRGKTAAQFIQGMRKKINPNENYSTNKKYFSCGQMEHFSGNVPLNRDDKLCQSTPGKLRTRPQLHQGNISP